MGDFKTITKPVPGGAEEVIVGSARSTTPDIGTTSATTTGVPVLPARHRRLDLAIIDSQNCILTKDSPTAKSCSSNGTNPDGPQYAWLASELATTPPADCTGVAMHDNTLKDGSDSGASDAMDGYGSIFLTPPGSTFF